MHFAVVTRGGMVSTFLLLFQAFNFFSELFTPTSIDNILGVYHTGKSIVGVIILYTSYLVPRYLSRASILLL